MTTRSTTWMVLRMMKMEPSKVILRTIPKQLLGNGKRLLQHLSHLGNGQTRNQRVRIHPRMKFPHANICLFSARRPESGSGVRARGRECPSQPFSFGQLVAEHHNSCIVHSRIYAWLFIILYEGRLYSKRIKSDRRITRI